MPFKTESSARDDGEGRSRGPRVLLAALALLPLLGAGAFVGCLSVARKPVRLGQYVVAGPGCSLSASGYLYLDDGWTLLRMPGGFLAVASLVSRRSPRSSPPPAIVCDWRGFVVLRR
jgi:hypothetical protein